MQDRSRKYGAYYESNTDYHATYENACLDPSRVGSISQTEKGHISLKFKGLEEVSVLVSAQGTVQIFYYTLDELNACLNLLKEILVPRVGQELCLEPRGTYSLVDKVRSLIQEGRIMHDMSLDLEEFSELTGWKREDVRMPCQLW